MRSELLTYWTGKDISVAPSSLDDRTRTEYAKRLFDILDGGFWMMTPSEELLGRGDLGNPSFLRYKTPMVCFTELRLSQSKIHYSRYGMLGIVVHRRFALERCGGPVHYLRSHPDEPIVGNLRLVFEWLDKRRKAGDAQAEMAHTAINFQVAFLKAMSTIRTEDFAFLDEHEWRIVHSDLQINLERIVATGVDRPLFRVPLQPNDIRMVIVPDDDVRNSCRARLQMWAKDSSPPMITVHEAAQL